MKFKTGAQSLGLNKAEKEIKKDGLGNHLKAKAGVYSDEATILVHLYGRGFLGGNREERLHKVEVLLRSKKAIANLLTLVKKDGDRDDTAEKSQLYINTKVVLERYLGQPGAFSFLVDDSSRKLTLYSQTQARGNCFIYGPLLSNSYLLQKHGLGLGVIDVQKYICRTFTDQELYDYVLFDNGGDSVSTFETVLKVT
ncbi:expressed unknown protein [Seminavis robusta]|uniref:Uncharacterized protein n=1 Tax=Seminavis robusta TaxID=568900 RepID=A0A9N8HFK4_9STRA|nr:expressed unknown protein [Seminavis robusta]|eukprot:Sro460_g147540.1 n/a (197) ;mRNA; f:38360-38950